MIKRLKYAYARCLDLKRWDELATLFTEDAVAAYSGGGYTFEGRDAILDFLQRSMGAETFHSSHKMHHPEIDLTGPTTARAPGRSTTSWSRRSGASRSAAAPSTRTTYVKVAGSLADQAHRLPAGVRGDPAARQRRGTPADGVVVGDRRAQRAPCGMIAGCMLACEPAVVDDFRRDGFVVVDGLLDRRTSSTTTSRSSPTRSRAASATRRRSRNAAAYAQSFHQCINLWEDYPESGRSRSIRARAGRGRAARRRRRAAVARPGAVQGGRRTRDRPAPGPPVLADPRDRHRHRVDPVPGLDARERRDGLPPRARTPSACASS